MHGEPLGLEASDDPIPGLQDSPRLQAEHVYVVGIRDLDRGVDERREGPRTSRDQGRRDPGPPDDFEMKTLNEPKRPRPSHGQNLHSGVDEVARVV